MAINFNSLPQEKPAQGSIIPKGTYVGTIVKAEMKTPKYDDSKPDYLSIQMKITDPVAQTDMGMIFPIFTESEAALPRYQLQRFITALELPITGDFELKDLTKMVVNKQLKVDVCPEKAKENEEPQRSVVDITAQCFYPLDDKVAAIIEDTFTTSEQTPATPAQTPSY